MIIEERERPPEALGQTHVLVIGIGEYPWLVGGTEQRDVGITEAMGQLGSPPLSARRFADWWLDSYRDPERPLGSLAMLLSDPADQNYNRPDGTVIAVPHATIEAIVDAADVWSERGRANADDMMVFYFCGHGLAAGWRQALLARNYGEHNNRPMRGAIDYDGFMAGMSGLAARRQLIFIDACRMASEALLRSANENGDVLVAAGPHPTTGMRKNIYFATLNGRPAYGLTGGLTLFTRGVLNAFRGAGANNIDDEDVWRLNSAGIAAALEHFAGSLADPEYGLVQPPQMDALSPFEFHLFDDEPRIPVYALPVWHEGASPGQEMASITISIGDQPVVHWDAPWNAHQQCSWAPDRFVSWLKPDCEYKVTIAFGDESEAAWGKRHVHAPYGLIKVKRDG